MSSRQWVELGDELGRRSGGTREAGAFLLGSRLGRVRRVSEFVYYDDLDPACLRGDIHLAGTAYGPLRELCRTTGTTVVADVHTHGGTSVRQSFIDADNPMIAREGHLAVIVPHLAQQPYHPAQVGVHEYLGERGWRVWTHRGAARRIALRGHP
jgi:hypothetical protein